MKQSYKFSSYILLDASRKAAGDSCVIISEWTYCNNLLFDFLSAQLSILSTNRMTVQAQYMCIDKHGYPKKDLSLLGELNGSINKL